MPVVLNPRDCSLNFAMRLQGLYTEMKFEKPSRIQAKTLPMILQPPYRSLIAQVRLHFWVAALMNPVASSLLHAMSA